MKNEMEETLIESLELVRTWLEKTGDFVSEQTPLLVQEILTYKFYLSLSLFGVGILALIALNCIGVFLINLSENADNTHDKEFYEMASAGVFFFGNALSLFVIFANLTWLKIWLAPRLYIIEYVTHTINRMQ